MKNMLTIEEVAKIAGVSTRTIIRWEEEGKLETIKRDRNGFRLYSFENVERIMAIRYVKSYL